MFKGQLAATTIDKLSEGSRRPASFGYDEVAAKVSLGLLDEEHVATAQTMAAVYVAIASFENTVRDLVSTRLLEQKGANWWDSSNISTDIKNRAATRQKEEEKIRWHRARGLNPIYYTELTDLTAIIQGNWASFEDLLHDIEWMRQIVKSLERSRNVIMHSGQLSIDDIERVGVLIRDWLRQVGG